MLTAVCYGAEAAWGASDPVAQTALLEVNVAGRAELESLPGLGVQLVERLLKARATAPFSDWADLRKRVAGIGPVTAKKLSAQGLRVNGLAFAD